MSLGADLYIFKTQIPTGFYYVKKNTESNLSWTVHRKSIYRVNFGKFHYVIWWKIYFCSFKFQNWRHTNVLGLNRDDELTYNRHVTHYCFASLRVTDFVFFSWHPKMAWFWIALYSHCALCWTRHCCLVKPKLSLFCTFHWIHLKC